MTGIITPSEYGGQMGGKRRGVPVKTLKKILKKAGLKTTGKKAALTRRAKQAKLVKKGGDPKTDAFEGDEEEKRLEEETKRLAEEAKRKADEEMQAMAKGAKGATFTGSGSKRKSRSKKGIYGMGGMFN